MPTASSTTRTPLMLLGIVILIATLVLLSLARQSGRLGARYVRSCGVAARQNDRIACWQAYSLIDPGNVGARKECSQLCNHIGLAAPGSPR